MFCSEVNFDWEKVWFFEGLLEESEFLFGGNVVYWHHEWLPKVFESKFYVSAVGLEFNASNHFSGVIHYFGELEQKDGGRNVRKECGYFTGKEREVDGAEPTSGKEKETVVDCYLHGARFNFVGEAG